jgi:gluconate 2-dehydrogenase gamma chain
MRPDQGTRRNFLLQLSGAAGAAWINAQWPAIVAAAQHAHNAKGAVKFEVLTPEQARQVEAIAAQIIPSDELPGAREAGVVYFIDRALKTFAKDSLQTYVEGLAMLNQLTSEKFPVAKTFADAAPEQQLAALTEFTSEEHIGQRRRGSGSGSSNDFFQTIRMHVVFGFLADPSAGGNRDYAGWKVVQRDPAPSFSPPFGYYDKDYAGWQSVKAEMEKK